MLSVEPILERALRMSGAGAVPGRDVVLVVVVVEVAVVEEAARGARGTGGFFSGTVPEVEDGVAGLVAVVRGREAVVVEPVLRVVVVLDLVESAGREREGELFRVLMCFIVGRRLSDREINRLPKMSHYYFCILKLQSVYVVRLNTKRIEY